MVKNALIIGARVIVGGAAISGGIAVGTAVAANLAMATTWKVGAGVITGLAAAQTIDSIGCMGINATVGLLSKNHPLPEADAPVPAKAPVATKPKAKAKAKKAPKQPTVEKPVEDIKNATVQEAFDAPEPAKAPAPPKPKAKGSVIKQKEKADTIV